MTKFLLPVVAVAAVALTSCTTTDLPPQVQTELQEIAEDLAPFVLEHDADGDGVLSAGELEEMPPVERAQAETLQNQWFVLYQEGIRQNSTMFVNFLRGLGIPAPPGSEVPASVLAAMLFKRPRRQLVATLKHLSPAGEGTSFYDAGRSLLSIVGLVDSTKASEEAADAEVASINTTSQPEQLNG